MSRRVRVAVVGGGISGLSTTYYLSKQRGEQCLDFDISLLEKESRLGGVIRSERVGDLLMEAGPEGWASYKRAARKLVQDLGIQDEVLGSNDFRRKTFVAREGNLAALPDGMTFLAPVEPLAFWRTAPLSLRGKLRTLFEPFISRSQGDLSVRDFFSRRLGVEFTDELLEPLLSAIFGAEIDQISAPCVMPELYRAEQRAGSLWKGLRKIAKLTSTASVLHTMRSGMARLTERLEKELGEVSVHAGLSDLRLSYDTGSFRVSNGDLDSSFDFVVLCTPATASARLVEPFTPELAGLLQEVPYSTSTIVYLAYRRDEFSHPLDGFGFVVPRAEARVIDACTWVNRKFDDRCSEDTVLLRFAIHDARRVRSNASDDELASAAHGEVKRFMGVSCEPTSQHVFRVDTAIPQLRVGHVKRVADIQAEQERHRGLIVAGSFMGGVGVPDCIQTGQNAALRIANQISGVTVTP
jgi:oxygen-dependent protoporphyrinogen oxidase